MAGFFVASYIRSCENNEESDVSSERMKNAKKLQGSIKENGHGEEGKTRLTVLVKKNILTNTGRRCGAAVYTSSLVQRSEHETRVFHSQ